jgi:FGGY-family pentulose kinase
MSSAYLGVDVGTGSARAGLFDASGLLLGAGSHPIVMGRPAEDFVEQSSEDIWSAVRSAVRQALSASGVAPAEIRGIGFDATCSLVVLGPGGAPLSVSPTGESRWNVIVWMDHRAKAQASRLSATRHDVLRYVGGRLSPEMQTPKLAWLREHMPDTFRAAAAFFDLPDYLAFRATDADVRSECTTTCKWTYLAHERRFDAEYFRAAGLGELADEGFRRVGTQIRPVGERAGVLSERAALELGLAPGTPVAVALIDAHAGGVGALGVAAPGAGSLSEKMVLVCGTSTCHMAVSEEPRFVEGVWGPYWSAMVPGLWLAEGGQSATGALIDHTIFSHARGQELRARAEAQRTTVYALLNGVVEELAARSGREGRLARASLTRDLHVLPDHHGNRSPRADASLRGAVDGLTLSDSTEALAMLYYATVQALAYGTRHIVDALRARGFDLRALVAVGGDTKNTLFVQEHADVVGMPIVLPHQTESVLLGSAMLAAVASGDRATLSDAMATMSGHGTHVLPSNDVGRYHAAKYQVFLRMHESQRAYRETMAGALADAGERSDAEVSRS